MSMFGGFALEDVQRVLSYAYGEQALALQGLSDADAQSLEHLRLAREGTMLAGRIVDALMEAVATNALHWPEAPNATITPADAGTLETLPTTDMSTECVGGPFDQWTGALPHARTLWVAELDRHILLRLTALGDLPSIPLGAKSLGYYERHQDRALWRPLPKGRAE